ncbi:MAG: ABC transporter permease, partial [Mycobacteriales bacterium]
MTSLTLSASPRGLGGLLKAREMPVGLALLVVLVFTQLSNHGFLGSQGRKDLLLAVAITGLMAVGETFVVVMRHVDLSVGSTLGLSAYTTGYYVSQHPQHALVTVVVLGLLVGAAVGLVNGVLVAVLKLPALVVTLGTLYVVQGIQALVTGSDRINSDQLPRSVVRFGLDTFLGIPYLMWVCLIAAAAGSWFLRTLRTGRDLYAVGSNPPAALLVGIPVVRRTVLAFALSGACAGLAGVLYLSRFGGVDAT